MFNRQTGDDWAEQVPIRVNPEPYEDYGWEQGESVLPEFRKPDVYFRPEERQRVYRKMQQIERLGMPRFDPRFNPPRPPEYYLRTSQPARREMMRFMQANGQKPWLSPGPFQGEPPEGWRRSDQAIQDIIGERLSWHGWIDASGIAVEVHDGIVTLDGSVDDREMRRAAEDVAWSVYGVHDVINNLAVRNRQRMGYD